MKGVLMTRRGRKRRLELDSAYRLLLAAGVGTAQACRLLGIGRKTGYRWRAENGDLPPATLPERSRSNRFLSLLEPQRIATPHRQGLGVRAIAAAIGRAASTLSREPRRNTLPHDRGGYEGDLAHARARQRARRPRRSRLLEDARLRAEVQAKPGAGVKPAADHRAPAPHPPGPAALAGGPRNHLPGALPGR
jgi:transposase, IS30 family